MNINSFVALLLLALILISVVSCDDSGDYYQLLGVTKDADNRQIRKAFKKAALRLHPDKNKDPNANEEFSRLNRAYEVLKDEEMRKKYDMYGEEGLKDEFAGRGAQYHSWKYYYEDFGIYDNDEEIITLSWADFSQSVRNSQFVWFVNFYSPACSHCHQLAPSWRRLSKELEGVVRIGAVNCEEDWRLCREEGIRSYPSLILYPFAEKYSGVRETDAMVDYVLKRVAHQIVAINNLNYNTFHTLSTNHINAANYWVLFFCYENTDCLLDDTKKKLSIMLKQLVNVAEISCSNDDKSICEYFKASESMIALYPNISENRHNYYEISSGDSFADTKTLFVSISAKLPNIKKLSSKQLKAILEELKSPSAATKPSILVFTSTNDDNELNQIEMKRLSALLPDINIAKVYCDKEISLCSQFYIKKFPTIIVLKLGLTYEVYHGRPIAYDIATFAKESLSSQLRTLDPTEFEENVIQSHSYDKPWFVDFFAPWCPPCMRLLPELRKASRTANHLVNFGTIDCTVHSQMCTKYNVRSYPTVRLYNHSNSPHQFHGSHSEHELIEFIQETLSPSVISLDPNLFEESVINRKEQTLWIVDFYAPWCGPCQQLSTQWRKLAKTLKEETAIKVSQMDCQAYQEFCTQNGITSYPTIRLYPIIKKTYGFEKNEFYHYRDYNRDAQSIRMWIYKYMPSLAKEIDSEERFDIVLLSKNVWLLDFHAPWCGHCQVFAPEFELIAKKLKPFKVKTAKVNCQDYPRICGRAHVNAYPTVKLYLGSQNDSPQDPRGIYIDGQHSDVVVNTVKSYLNEQPNEQKNSIKDEL